MKSTEIETSRTMEKYGSLCRDLEIANNYEQWYPYLKNLIKIKKQNNKSKPSYILYLKNGEEMIRISKDLSHVSKTSSETTPEINSETNDTLNSDGIKIASIDDTVIYPNEHVFSLETDDYSCFDEFTYQD